MITEECSTNKKVISAGLAFAHTDVVILDESPLTVDPATIKDNKVPETILRKARRNCRRDPAAKWAAAQ